MEGARHLTQQLKFIEVIAGSCHRSWAGPFSAQSHPQLPSWGVHIRVGAGQLSHIFGSVSTNRTAPDSGVGQEVASRRQMIRMNAECYLMQQVHPGPTLMWHDAPSHLFHILSCSMRR